MLSYFRLSMHPNTHPIPYLLSSASKTGGSDHGELADKQSGGKQHELWQRLLLHIERERPYLRPLLMQADLAETLGVSTRTLCRIVTQYSPDNFNTFINRYRVEEACRLMRDPRYGDLSVEMIAHQAGFNSRGSFYRAFKHIKGTSPAQYRHGQP